jgi:hypothetical protein
MQEFLLEMIDTNSAASEHSRLALLDWTQLLNAALACFACLPLNHPRLDVWTDELFLIADA